MLEHPPDKQHPACRRVSGSSETGSSCISYPGVGHWLVSPGPALHDTIATLR